MNCSPIYYTRGVLGDKIPVLFRDPKDDVGSQCVKRRKNFLSNVCSYRKSNGEQKTIA